MNGKVFEENAIIQIDPFEDTDFECMTDVTTVVIKLPSIKNDKFVL